MHNNNEWDKLVNQLTDETTPRQTLSLGLAIVALINIAALSSIGGVGVMLLNMIVIAAWPELSLVQPGIGYVHGAMLFSLWLAWFMFKSLFSARVNLNLMEKGR